MGKTFLTCCILFWIFNNAIYSQSTNTIPDTPFINYFQPKDSAGEVQIIQDKRIDSLIFKYKNDNYKNRTIPGFRIRIFMANNLDKGRQRATEAMRIFIEKFSGLGEEVYLVQESPDWKVYIGDFRTRTDAFRIKKQIESVFPNNRIVECQIDYTKL